MDASLNTEGGIHFVLCAINPDHNIIEILMDNFSVHSAKSYQERKCFILTYHRTNDIL